MSSAVSQIKISSVEVDRSDDGKYGVAIDWLVNGKSTCSVPGDYDICLFDTEKELESQRVKIAEGKDNEASVTFDCTIEDNKDYFVKVRSSEDIGKVESASKRLITDYYKNISGYYDGRLLTLAWEIDKTSTPQGDCFLTYGNGCSCVNTIYPGRGMAKLDGICFGEGKVFTAQAYSVSDEGASRGPKSGELTFYTAPPFIGDVEIKDGDNGADITVVFTSLHDDFEKVSLIFSANGEAVYETQPADVLAEKEANTYSVTVHIDAACLTRNELDKCRVSCAYINGNAKTLLSGTGSEMALAEPGITAEDIQNGKAVMRISYPEGIAVSGFELSDGNVVYGDVYTVDPAAEAMSARPLLNRNGAKRQGVSSKPASGFIQGYYLSADGSLIYRSTGFSEVGVTHTWNEELFKTPPAEEIVSGVLSLKGESGKYTLTVTGPQNLSIDDYNGFIDKIKDTVTSSGFFALSDAILRLSPQAINDTSYLFCAYSPSNRLSDIRPGMRLTANTAIYMPQYDPGVDDAQGFVSTNNVGWNFIFDSDSGFLEPDLFIGKIAKYMEQNSLNTDTTATYASGIADFMSLPFRQPYYRILFPSSLKHTVETEDPFPHENTVIMASESYGAIQEKCKTIADNSSNLTDSNLPLMIFRGRSALSLSIPVQINGNICYVPVGCTASQALAMHGIGGGALVKMLREDGDRIPRPIFAGEGADLEKIVLIPGDRLGV